MAKIYIDSYKCNDYSNQLNYINKRIKKLDRAIYDLYDEIGWDNHKYVQIADYLVSYNRTLEGCSSYLIDTSEEFRRLEESLYLNDIKDLLTYNPAILSDTKTAISAVWNGVLEAIQKNNETKSEITKKYADILKEYFRGKAQGYVDIYGSNATLPDKIVAVYDWFRKDMWGDVKTLNDWIDDISLEYTYKEANLMPTMSTFFKTLSDLDILIDVAKGAKEYSETGDFFEAFDDVGFAIMEKGMGVVDKLLSKKINLKYLGIDALGKNILWDSIVNMPKNFVNGIKEFAENGTGTAGSIFVDTTLGAGTQAITSAAKPIYILGTAVSYPVVDQLCEAVGYDLSGKYEEMTGKTGLTAVFDAQKKLWVDVVYKGVRDKAVEAVDNFYDSEGWKSWQSGFEIMIGRK